MKMVLLMQRMVLLVRVQVKTARVQTLLSMYIIVQNYTCAIAFKLI